MDFISKVGIVRDDIDEWQKKNGNKFVYVINGFYRDDDGFRVDINPDEHKDIIEYLALTGYIRIVNKKPLSAELEILPKIKPIINLKTLQLIAKDIGNLDNGYNLVKFLKDCGVDNNLIVYPNTKWRMVYAIFKELAISKNPKDHKILLTIIEEACHPLMHDGNIEAANKITERFNSLLKYDRFTLADYKLKKIDQETKENIDDKGQKINGKPIVLDDVEKIKITERVKEMLSDKSSENKEYNIKEFFNLCSDSTVRRRIYYLLEEAIIHHILEAAEDNNTEIAIAIGVKQELSSTQKRSSFGRLMFGLSTKFGDSLIQKIWNGNFLTPTETKLFLDKSGFDPLPTAFNVRIKFQKENIDTTTKSDIFSSRIILKDLEIKYNDNGANLEIGDTVCQLPPYKNEHYFCRAIFSYDVNKPVDWSEIYEAITGYYEKYYGKPQKVKENWRIVYDAMEAVNKRVQKVIKTNDKLFTWQEKTVKRNY